MSLARKAAKHNRFILFFLFGIRNKTVVKFHTKLADSKHTCTFITLQTDIYRKCACNFFLFHIQ